MKIFLCSHLVMLRWNGRETAANLERISAEMATVDAEESLPAGTLVRVVTGSCELAGKVTGCEIDPLGYFVDIALEEAWSPEIFRPDHLFDPDLLPAD